MASPQPNPTYTVFIRLPFPRADFVDPPPVNWDSSKDEALWNIVSEVTKTEIDWNDIASRFQVTVDFLLQQVAFLTERHATQVRAQMRRAAAAARGSAAPSPVPGADGPAVVPEGLQQQAGTGGGTRPRTLSSLSIRRDSPLPRNDGSIPGSPMRTTPRPQTTRTSSTNTTVYTTRNLGTSSKGGGIRTSTEAQRRRLSSLPITTSADEDAEPEPDPPSPGPADTSSAESSSSESSPAQSRIIRRPPRFQGNNDGPSFVDDDDDEEEPAFLPYRAQQTDGSASGHHDLSATLRGNPQNMSSRRLHKSRHRSQASDSSASSAAHVVAHPHAGGAGGGDKNKPSGPLSPRRTMELTGRSPGPKGKGYSRDSDGTPSMGSSFSDLDDASVTQSALEEALASRMQDGGTMGSRISTFGNVMRSRYFPKSNNP